MRSGVDSEPALSHHFVVNHIVQGCAWDVNADHAAPGRRGSHRDPMVGLLHVFCIRMARVPTQIIRRKIVPQIFADAGNDTDGLANLEFSTAA